MTSLTRVKLITEEAAKYAGVAFDAYVNSYLERHSHQSRVLTIVGTIPLKMDMAIIAYEELEKAVNLQIDEYKSRNSKYTCIVFTNGQYTIYVFIEHPSEYTKIHCTIQNGLLRAHIHEFSQPYDDPYT